MPATPYAKVLVSINGGAQQSGGLTCAYDDEIQLSLENTTGILNPRWTIFSFPAGWACPAGWSTDTSNGTFYFDGISPSLFAMPSAPLWGKVFFKFTSNGNTLIDKATALKITSPGGLHDMGTLEEGQFGGSYKLWVADHQANLRLIDSIVASAGAPTGPAGGELSGTYPNPSVAKILGATLSGTPSSTKLLLFTGPTTAIAGQITNNYIAAGAGIALDKVLSQTQYYLIQGGAIGNTAALLTNNNVDAAAAIAGSKIAPAFTGAVSGSYFNASDSVIALQSGGADVVRIDPTYGLTFGDHAGGWTSAMLAVDGGKVRVRSIAVPVGIAPADLIGAEMGNTGDSTCLTLEAASGANQAGGHLNILGGKGTGNGAPGKVRFYLAVAGSTGSTVESWSSTAILDLDANGGSPQALVGGALTATGLVTASGFVGATLDRGGSVTVGGTSATSVVVGRTGIGVTVPASLTLSALSTGILHSGSGGAVTSSAVVNADVDAAAAIACTKTDGNFGTGIDVKARSLLAASGLSFNTGRVALSVAGSSPVTVTTGSIEYGVLELTGALSGDVAVTMPVTSGARWRIKNKTTGNFVLTIVGGANTFPLGRGQSKSFWADGTDLQCDDPYLYLYREAWTLVGSVGTVNTQIAKLPTNLDISSNKMWILATPTGGTATTSLGVSSGGGELLVAPAALATGTVIGNLSADFGSAWAATASGVNYATAQALWLKNVIGGSNITVGVVYVQVIGVLGGYV